MKIIGVGIGRTGTLSLKAALETLGYRPCYHILDVFRSPRNIKILRSVGAEPQIDWKYLFRKYEAGVDFPFTTQYKECLAAFPAAKVILTVREPDEWYESARETVYPIQRVLVNYLPGGKKVGRKTIWYQLFDGRFEDREHAIRAFHRHTEAVKRSVAEENLLIFDVKDGWGPLCDFLDRPVPDEPFPHINRRSTMKYLMAFAVIITLALLIGTLYLVFRLATKMRQLF